MHTHHNTHYTIHGSYTTLTLHYTTLHNTHMKTVEFKNCNNGSMPFCELHNQSVVLHRYYEDCCGVIFCSQVAMVWRPRSLSRNTHHSGLAGTEHTLWSSTHNAVTNEIFFNFNERYLYYISDFYNLWLLYY